MDEQKIKEVFSDEAFVSSLLEMETVEDVQSAVAAKGIDLSARDIESIRAQLVNNDNGEELSEEDLENVAGGSIIAIIGLVATCIGATASAANFVHNVTNRRW